MMKVIFTNWKLLIIFNWYGNSIIVLIEIKWNNKSKQMHQHLSYEKYKRELIFHQKKFNRYTILQKALIHKDYWENINIKEIIKKYNTSASTVYKIIKDYKK